MLDEEVADPTLDELQAGPSKDSVEALGVVWIGPAGVVRATPLSGRDELSVGRAENCDIVLQGPLVSRRHARLLRNSGFWFVQDLDSRNGVRLNGAAVKRGPLVAGSVLAVGSWLGVVRPFAPYGTPHYGVLGQGLFGGPELASALNGVEVAARADLPVVLEGETGTGKELFARAVHERTRRDGPFLAVNCAVFQPATAAAELFGYRRGAFTGAVDAHLGLVRAANGGSLLLDEIADLSIEIQAQLLRVIELGEVIPLGESRATRVNVRFIAATQRPLAHWVSEGRFRADLRARIEGLRIELPPLRMRLGDAPLLFMHSLRAHSSAPPQLDTRALEWLALREWPLNVRELVALARRALAAHPNATTLCLEQLTALVSDPQARSTQAARAHAAQVLTAPQPTSQSPGLPTLTMAPRRPRVDSRAFRPETLATFRAALERNSGSVTRTAAELNISRQRAYRILRQCAKSAAGDEASERR